MAHRCMPTALVILALSLTGCLGAAPTTHSSDVATVISSSFRGDATFDVLTGTYFPPQHGNFTRATARQTSNSNFEVAYHDKDSNAGILYHLIRPGNGQDKVSIPRGRDSELVDAVLRIRKEQAEASAEKGNYPALTFIELDATFELATKTTPLEAKWMTFTHTTRENEKITRVGHWLATGYQGMILLIQITYVDHMLQQSQDEKEEPLPLATVVEINKALAREMLESTRTFLQ